MKKKKIMLNEHLMCFNHFFNATAPLLHDKKRGVENKKGSLVFCARSFRSVTGFRIFRLHNHARDFQNNKGDSRK